VRSFDFLLLGFTLGLAGLWSLYWLSMATHELIDAVVHHVLPKNYTWWMPYAGVGFTGALSFGAFFMMLRCFRYAFIANSKS
jgi:hypothetical protein